MKPHVKALRKVFQTRTRIGKLIAADTCEKCLRHKDEFDRKLELHHKIALKDVDPDSGYDPNVQENLATLCHDCHKSFHASYEDMAYVDWFNNVSLKDCYESLAAHRAEKARIRSENAMKHRNRSSQSSSST